MADYDAGPRAAGGVGLGDYALEREAGGLERNGALSQDAHPRFALRVGYIVGGGGGFGKVGAASLFDPGFGAGWGAESGFAGFADLPDNSGVGAIPRIVVGMYRHSAG